VLGSALCMDKDVFKSMLRDHDIPVTRYHAQAGRKRAAYAVRLSVFVKPARLGSSVDHEAHDDEELRRGVIAAFEHGARVR
jgi:D-alanine-D-alanine ligase-like ATP-grasp enzyme